MPKRVVEEGGEAQEGFQRGTKITWPLSANHSPSTKRSGAKSSLRLAPSLPSLSILRLSTALIGFVRCSGRRGRCGSRNFVTEGGGGEHVLADIALGVGGRHSP